MSQSFDHQDLSQIRTMLSGMLQRLDNLERHVGLTHDAESATVHASASVTETDVPPVIAPVAANEPDEAEIIFAELRETATAPLGESPVLTDAPPHAIASPLNDHADMPRKPLVAGESLESLIGGRVLTWVGGILLILAAAFFVVWSWRHLDVPPWGRVTFIHAVGMGAIIAGSWFRGRNFQIQARVLYGVGIFVLYAAAFAMTHLYQLGGEMRELYGFVDGALITGLAILLALRNQSVGIILLGALGGYLTPM